MQGPVQEIACSLCRNATNTRKVSAITNASGFMHQTALSQMLAPPPPPIPKQVQRATNLNIHTLAAILLTTLLLSMLIQASANLVVQLSSSNPLINVLMFLGLTNEMGALTPGGFINLLLSEASIALLILLYSRQKMVKRRQEAKAAIVIEENKKDYSRWQLAMFRWDHLYYCQRHDIVFDLRKPTAYRPPLKMRELL